MSDSALARLLEHLPGPDTVSRAAVAERAAATLRPAGAFGRLDAVASWLAAWQWSTTPKVEKPAVVVFGADHGVTAEGVSAYPGEVTQAMVAAMAAQPRTTGNHSNAPILAGFSGAIESAIFAAAPAPFVSVVDTERYSGDTQRYSADTRRYSADIQPPNRKLARR